MTITLLGDEWHFKSLCPVQSCYWTAQGADV